VKPYTGINALLVVVPGFGKPQLDNKKQWLHENMALIKNTFTGRIDLRIFNYEKEPLNLNITGINITEHIEPGYLGEFIYKYVQPDSVLKYDYILILLDDIQLLPPTDIDSMIHQYNTGGYNILSPSLSRCSQYITHKHMATQSNNTVRNVKWVELFCYLMDKESYIKYHSLFDKNTRWMWGIDSCGLPFIGLVCGLHDGITMRHNILGKSYSKPGAPNPHEESRRNRMRFRKGV
jgi:hypothetical protein